jgi:predicted Zn-dependent peptidase
VNTNTTVFVVKKNTNFYCNTATYTAVCSLATMNNITCHTFESGLQLVTEKISSVKTVAVNWSVRSGVATNEHDGDSVLLSELVQRGARDLTAKQHNDALELLGAKRQVECGIEFFRVSGVMLGKKVETVLPLLGDYLMNATLPEEDLAACKSLCMQSIQSLADNPARQVSIALGEHHHSSPYNRSTYGDPASIESASIRRLRSVYDSFTPDGSVLIVVGDIEHDKIVAVVEQIANCWDGASRIDPLEEPPDRGVHWIKQETSQSHIAIAFDAPNANEDGELQESIAISIFGGATSGRLFTQVRQRRSLCYSVSAHYASSKNRSTLRIHAGTTPQRADETVSVCLDQLNELRMGITRDEFDRAVLRMKSRSVMRGESTPSRASMLWIDHHSTGKPKTLNDRLREIDSVTYESVNEWLEARVFDQGTLVTLGPLQITVDNDLFCRGASCH